MKRSLEDDRVSGNENVEKVETPSRSRFRLIGYYNYTVVLTYIGTLFGFWSVLLASSGKFAHAALCLGGAGVCDMFDGSIASTKKDRSKDEKRFGTQIDSLNDVVCFGVCPAFFLTQIFPGRVVVQAIAGVYMLCALIRLAYFNVLEERIREGVETEGKRCFIGVPVTIVAFFLPATYILARLVPAVPEEPALVGLLVALGIGFLLPIRVGKVNAVGMAIFSTIAIVGALVLLWLR